MNGDGAPFIGTEMLCAGCENRTRDLCLGSTCFTTKLIPHKAFLTVVLPLNYTRLRRKFSRISHSKRAHHTPKRVRRRALGNLARDTFKLRRYTAAVMPSEITIRYGVPEGMCRARDPLTTKGTPFATTRQMPTCSLSAPECSAGLR